MSIVPETEGSDEPTQEAVDVAQAVLADTSKDALKEGGPVEVEGGYESRGLDSLTRQEREEYVKTAADAAKSLEEAAEEAEEDEDLLEDTSEDEPESEPQLVNPDPEPTT